MGAPSANSPQKIKPLTNSINLLNKDIASSISTHLSDRDLLNLCLTSKGLHSIFFPSLEKHLMTHFLKYVVEGRLDKVEKILNKNKKVVFLHGDITDLSGRIFKRIAAFQYAAWALDKEMWELILKYLSEADAYDQLMAFEQERPDITEVYGKRFSFQPLFDAYQKYIGNFKDWDWEQRRVCWCKEVGGAQRQMPAWFAYIFCEEGEDKVWPTNDFKKSFTRDPKHLSWWFDGEEYGGKLGGMWAARRGRGAWGEMRLRCAGAGFSVALRDRSPTFQLMSERTYELSRLIERVSQSCSEIKKFNTKSNNF